MRRLPFAVWLLLASCARSPDPAFYALSPRQGQLVPARRLNVELRRPALPGYLDRPHIVRRVTAERLALDADERWAAPLDEMVGATLADDLAERLPSSVVYTEAGTISSAPDVRVEVQLSRFELTARGSVELRAEIAVRWPGSTDVARMSRHALSAAPATTRTADIVVCMSTLLGELADAIARGIALGPPAAVGVPPPSLAPQTPSP